MFNILADSGYSICKIHGEGDVVKICMIAVTHDLLDDRMYWKEAVSLKNHGYEVVCIVSADMDEGGITEEGIRFIKIKRRTGKNKLKKIIFHYADYLDLFNKAKEINASVYQLHDLSLNLIGRKLKNLPHRPKVIYDVYESFPDMIRDYIATSGIKTIIKLVYAGLIDKWEIHCSKYYDLIITADSSIADRFRKKLNNKQIEEIYNYTDLFDNMPSLCFEERVYDIVYCGSITRVRGILNLLEAIKVGKKEKIDIKLLLIGSFNEEGLKEKVEIYIKENHLEKNVTMLGAIPHNLVGSYLKQCRIGVVPLLPIPKFYKNIPTKQFEYMMFGLPVVGSKLPPIRKYVEESNCGELVESREPKEIWKAAAKILNNRQLYQYYSINGIKAAKEKYNWTIMDKKLTNLYEALK
jgi:glycosyltransferase involved in cell wall biosynthesis